jgi:hypothetical protein
MDHTLVFTKMTRMLVEGKAFASNPFTLVDVGSSGGISPFWRVFEPLLAAVGIDPVVTECERLNARETNPAVRYRSMFVGLPNDHPFVRRRGDKEPWTGNPWDRLSTKLATDILQSKVKKEEKLAVLNDWQSFSQTGSLSKVGIDALVRQEQLFNVDFVKIDVDGYDLDVLLSAQDTTVKHPIIGYALEVNFFGSHSETDHTFHNTDRLMRQWGFDLFSLSVRHYSSSALPAPFVFDWPGYTAFGRPYQGDAIYLRDPVAGNYCGPSLSSSKLLKLACLYECFGLPDHAAELLVSHGEAIASLCNVEELINILASQVDPESKSYSGYIEKFSRDPTSFYPSRGRAGNERQGMIGSLRSWLRRLS